jgi:hypothetical protein
VILDSKLVRFTASIVVVDDSDEDFILVGFAEEQDGQDGEALQFQRSHGFDEQDIAAGMNNVYVGRNDQSQSGYGGIDRVELHRDHLEVVLSGATAKSLGTEQFQIALSLTAPEFDRLRAGLQAVFQGFAVFVEAD